MPKDRAEITMPSWVERRAPGCWYQFSGDRPVYATRLDSLIDSPTRDTQLQIVVQFDFNAVST